MTQELLAAAETKMAKAMMTVAMMMVMDYC
jgi:hypothetical protein